MTPGQVGNPKSLIKNIMKIGLIRDVLLRRTSPQNFINENLLCLCFHFCRVVRVVGPNMGKWCMHPSIHYLHQSSIHPSIGLVFIRWITLIIDLFWQGFIHSVIYSFSHPLIHSCMHSLVVVVAMVVIVVVVAVVAVVISGSSSGSGSN